MKQPKLVDPKLLRAAVYGANDGIITTFAVVAGVAGAQLSADIVLILGFANLIADGISMGVGDYIAERSEQRLRKNQGTEYSTHKLWMSGLVTIIAFILAGSLPLLPYVLLTLGIQINHYDKFVYSIVATAAALFFVGSLRTFVTKGSWWKNGLEMLSIGALAASVAYGIGALIEHLM